MGIEDSKDRGEEQKEQKLHGWASEEFSLFYIYTHMSTLSKSVPNGLAAAL